MKRQLIDNEVLFAELAEQIARGKSVTITARGQSMRPFITHDRDRVILSPFVDSDLQAGVAVLARCHHGKTVMHRILQRQGETLLLEGDGNYRQTEQARTTDVIGVLTGVYRRERLYLCSGKTWRLYSFLWRGLRPLRRYLLFIDRRIVRKLGL